MNQLIYNRLIETAARQDVTTYGAIAPLVGLDMGNPSHRVRISKLLEEICRYEVSEGRPMLSVVVVSSRTSIPGPGFFDLAKDLRRHNGKDNQAFFVEELRRIHAFWKGRE